MRQHLEVIEAQKKVFSAWQHVVKYDTSNADALQILRFAVNALREEAALLREIERVKELEFVLK